MALGTRYARTGRKADLLTRLGLHRMAEDKWTRAQVDEEIKTLRSKKVAEIQKYIKSVLNKAGGICMVFEEYYLCETVCFTSGKEHHLIARSHNRDELEKQKTQLEEEHNFRCKGDPDRPNLIYRIGETTNLERID